MSPASLPLHGKTALVTGVSRRRGIGFAIARTLLAEGASVFFGHYRPHDVDQPWGGDDLDSVRDELRARLTPGASLGDTEVDLATADGPQDLFSRALELTGSLEILVCNHARSGMDDSLVNIGVSMLDAHYFTNARSTVLLTSLFARAFGDVERREPAKPGDVFGPSTSPNVEQFANQSTDSDSSVDDHDSGRVVWLTSGQARPMPGEVAYAMSKAALAGLVPTAAAELARVGILLNAINPGPVNTGYLDDATSDRSTEVLHAVRASMPLGRFGHPDDVARLVAWLVSDDGRWMTGQVITYDSGFSL